MVPVKVNCTIFKIDIKILLGKKNTTKTPKTQMKNHIKEK